MVKIGTAVMQRLLLEAERRGLEKGKQLAINVALDLMPQTVRFGGFDTAMMKGCAERVVNDVASR